MAKTVINAFNEFQKNTLSIDPTQNDNAKASRDWLLDRITGFDNDKDFVHLYNDIHFHFGSFARKTKIPPLDDIDILIGISAQGCQYNESEGWNNIKIIVPYNHPFLLSCCHDDSSYYLNSRKVINRFINKLSQVHQYRLAEINRNQQACKLSLTSYPWSFDIVPCFLTVADWQGRTYYLIPNGNGHWMKTDPRIDKEQVSSINQRHSGKVLLLIRMAKFWQTRGTMPSMPSYLLESICLNYFKTVAAVSDYPDIEIANLLGYISTAVQQVVVDPKGIQNNINNLSREEITAISNRASMDSQKAKQARELEIADNQKASIAKWSEIFGPSFPKYE